MKEENGKKDIPFEGIDYTDCRGQCGTLPSCTACMKEKERRADETETEERARKNRDWDY